MVKKANKPLPPKPKKTAAASAGEPESQHILIQNRQIVGHDIKPGTPAQDGKSALASATPPSAKRTILPITINDGSEAEGPTPPDTPAQDPPAEPAADTPKSSDTAAVAAPESPAVQPPEPAPAAAPEPEETEEPEESEEPETAAAPEEDATDTLPSNGDTAAGAEADAKRKPAPATEKALKEAAEAAKREKEVEEYINNRHFFVPINAIARKRSIKVSAVLTVMTLLLALILVDLMLDSGIILLLQKIPHTHFFSLGG